MQKEGTGEKWRNIFRSSNSAAPSSENLNCDTLNGKTLELKKANIKTKSFFDDQADYAEISPLILAKTFLHSFWRSTLFFGILTFNIQR